MYFRLVAQAVNIIINNLICPFVNVQDNILGVKVYRLSLPLGRRAKL